MLEVRLLGKFVILSGGEPVAITSRPAQSLFAFLILNAGTGYRREKLAGLLWPDSLEETARGNLRHALWQIRKSLPPSTEYLLVDDLILAFNVSSEHWLDAAELKKLSESASADDLIEGLSNYYGELLPGFYDEWVVLEREHLNSVFEHHMARLMWLLEEKQRWLEILDWGERLIKLGHKPEPAYRALMSAHAAKGDMSKVAATYDRCLKSLKEFGVEPSEQTRKLYERLKSGKETFETEPTSYISEKQEHPQKTNMPVPITSFIGREREIEEVKHLLSTTRLLTLTGSGGIGKTRLAIQAAKNLTRVYKDGIWWVELAPVIDSRLVPQAVAQVLGVRESPGQPLTETLKNFLREKQLLLILDNCEHLITASAQLADDLLIYCENLKILTTSREALGITGETTMHVPVLSFPVLAHLSQLQNLKEFESVQLFAERAAAVQPELALTQENAFMVTQICHRLDGIPLALELAAARVKILSLEEIAKRLDDRFTLLTQGSRTALPRHQTLRAAIDWSHDLLTDPERTLFWRLSVFAGEFTFPAMESVAVGGDVAKSQVIDLLGQLIDKSLITVKAGSEDSGHETRYGMLETIREYAREKLVESGELEKLRQRHRDYFIALAERAEPKLKSGEQFEWLDRLELEHDNLRAAWDCAIESDADLALSLAWALLDFWLMRGNPSEGREWSAKLLELTKQWGDTARRAHVLSLAGRLIHQQLNYGAARQLLEQALHIARASGDKREIAFVVLWFGRTLIHQGDHQAAQSFLQESFSIYEELKDEWGVAMAFSFLAELAQNRGDYSQAKEFSMKSLSKFQAIGDQFRAEHVLTSLGEVARLEGQYERAAAFYEQALEILRNLRSGRRSLAIALGNLAWVWLHRGDDLKANDYFEESLKIYREGDEKMGMLDCLCGFAARLGMTGRPEQAACLFGALESLPESVGVAWQAEPADQKELDHYLAAVRGQLDEAAFEKAWAEGRAMTLEQAIEFALEKR